MAIGNPLTSTVLGGNPSNLGTMSAYDLIQKLDKDYPHRCITPDETVEHARFYAGKRDLIDVLLSKIKYEERS